MKNFLVLFLAAAQSAHDARSGQALPEAPAGDAESEATEQEMSRHIEMMQALMPGMKARMETIKSTTDLQERRGLLKAHLADMHKGMEMMHMMLEGLLESAKMKE